MALELRKIVTYTENWLIEGGKRADPPLRLYGVAAVLRSPWAGRGYVEDLMPEIREVAPQLGVIMTAEMLRLTGSGEAIEAYGKAAMAGANVEMQQASSLAHTLRFGNHYRNAVGATSYIPATNIRASAGALMTIPLLHKAEAGKRSHFLSIAFTIPDAPGPDEIVIALGAADGGQPHHRIGDRFKDIEELGSNTAV